MIKIYGMPSCPDCAYLDDQLEKRSDFLFINIGEKPAYLKELLKLRDTNPVFDQAKEKGSIGIPCFVLEDGTVTLNPEDVGLKSRPIEMPACVETSCCGPEGC